MVKSYSSKSSITADTIDKIVTLQGCPNVPTRTIDPLTTGGYHDTHSPSLQQCPGSHLTKLTRFGARSKLRRGLSCLRLRLLDGNSARRVNPSSAIRTASYGRARDNGVTRQHGFPKSNIISSDHKETCLHAREKQNVQTNCGHWTKL